MKSSGSVSRIIRIGSGGNPACLGGGLVHARFVAHPVDPTVLTQYCHGSRTPPEFLSLGYQVPPGIADATVPNPIFSLTPTATVDEGNNWINISWGPLSLLNTVNNTPLGNYGPTASSSVINLIPSTAGGALGAYTLAPATDFYGNARRTNNFPVRCSQTWS